MENAYGIGVKNRYELFYDEDVDPLEIIRQKEEEKEKRKSDKAHCKDKTKISRTGKPVTSSGLSKKKETPAVNTTKSNESTDIPNKSRIRPFNDRTSKNVRSFEETKEMEERKNFRNRDEHQPLNNDIREREGEIRRGRGGFRGRGRSRGRGGFFNNFEGRPRREFDRHSGSDKAGLRAVEKRDGAGANNWGDIKSEFSRRREAETTWMDEELDVSGDKQSESTWKDSLQESEIQNSAKEELTGEKCDDTVTENMESKENEPISEERPDESVREMTLDEWKREQEAKRAVPKYNLRKPGEGEDNNQWKKLYMLKKKAKDEEEDEEEEEEEDVDVIFF